MGINLSLENFFTKINCPYKKSNPRPMKFIILLCLCFQVMCINAFAQEYKYHTVAPEENIYRISQKYNISEEDIYKYNPDARNGVDVGTKLVIPLMGEKTASTDDTPVTFKTHKVAKKETLFGLSQRYSVDIDDIKKYNKQLYSKELQQGDEINIPVFAQAENSTPTNVSQPATDTQPATGSQTVEVSRPKAVAQSQDPVQDTKTREHIILPKETKYGIARKYGMTVDELEELNPTVDVLQPGIMLKVGTDVLDEPVIITDDDFQFYEVQPQETLYGLTRKFQVEQDSLIALNPALKDGLKSGMVLKVPTKDSEGRELEDIDVEMNTSAERERISLEGELKDFSTKNLVLMLPFNTNKVRNDSISNSAQLIQNDRAMRIALDFYSGALMAVETAKNLGISTDLKVYDTQQNAGTVTSIIQNNNFSNVDAVIGPLFQATSEEAAERLSNTKIPVISPLTNRELKYMPNLYQARPSDEMLRDRMVEYLAENSQGKNVIIIADASNSGIKNTLVNALPNARLVNPGGNNNISEGSVSPSLMKDRENWIILESDNLSLLASTTSALYRLARNYKIKLFTTSKNSSFDNDLISNEHLGRLQFHFPSEYKEFDETASNSFIDAYKSEYGVVPNKYTVRGYDLTLDVLLRLGAMGSLEKSVESNVVTEYVENKFYYRPKSNGGFYNEAIYIMHYDKDLNLKVAQ